VGQRKKKQKSASELAYSMAKGGQLTREGKSVTYTKCGQVWHNQRRCKGQRSTNVGSRTTKKPACGSQTPTSSRAGSGSQPPSGSEAVSDSQPASLSQPTNKPANKPARGFQPASSSQPVQTTTFGSQRATNMGSPKRMTKASAN
nr:hypothetical protein [Tanacetum cinerariifolium]